jgi:hypothetical protein
MHFIATSSFPMTDEQVIDLIAAKRGPEHVNAPAYRVMRRIDPDIVEAVCLLQEKADHARSMVDVYRDYHDKALSRGDMSPLVMAYYAGDVTRWQHRAARAAACARQLMGVE